MADILPSAPLLPCHTRRQITWNGN